MVQPTSPDDFASVPLTMYVRGKRYVIGEAVIKGRMLETTIGQPLSDEVMDYIMGGGLEFLSIVPKVEHPFTAKVPEITPYEVVVWEPSYLTPKETPQDGNKEGEAGPGAS